MATKAAATHFLQFRIQYSSIALLYYDYALTFPAEVNCDTWYKIIAALSVIGRAAVIVTFTARTYAVFARSKAILLSLAAIGLANDRCKSRTTDALGQQTIALVIVLTSDAEDFAKSFTTESLLLSISLVVLEYSSAILITIRSIQAFRIGGWKMQRQRLVYVIFEQGHSLHSKCGWDPSYAQLFAGIFYFR
ncbi:uncharacterized protein ARMOST_06767 [Armillaria ostoyae]|uniref:Uncharacterized protein n=1 Tax=Armillaria ostoyae TaxID=47428 RepID=A0A284R3Y0_ARMOS|nr:uncharacterized protein ARMOST_06767 [Armillaria ostoyae]